METNQKLQLAKEWYNDPSTTEKEKSHLEELFPELRDSEDERIRKEMLCVIKQIDENTTICGRKYDYQKWISWLEKQGEQKSVEWSEKNKKMLGIVFECIRFAQDHYRLVEEPDGESVKSWLLDHINPQTPQEWSEEDEKERKHLLGMLKGWLNTFRETIYKYDCNKAISWLESLKPQPKQQWSEEDESHIGRTLSYLESFKAYNIPHIEPIKKEISWLKSLKERCAFKPTNEQIIALRWTLNNIPYCRHKEELSGLLDQIKNL